MVDRVFRERGFACSPWNCDVETNGHWSRGDRRSSAGCASDSEADPVIMSLVGVPESAAIVGGARTAV